MSICTIIHTPCDNQHRCLGCYHSWREWTATKKQKELDKEPNTEYETWVKKNEKSWH